MIADEAHRSQYGLTEKIDSEGRVKVGAARRVRNSLPNATYIGFTGTPISQKDRSTREVFYDNEFNPLFEIELKGKRHLVPAVEEFIAAIDFDKRVIKFVLPEGLIE